MLHRSLLALLLCSCAGPLQSAPRTFAIDKGKFVLDGQPYQIISGEMHYPRVPRAYWRERFRMAKAMGLNTITTYVFWNLHEPRPGVYDFSGNNDVAEYIREAQQEGLNVILRPGPYICAEWEFGGFPSWLLKDRNMVVRSRDPKFLAAVSAWFKRLGEELAPLQIGSGGPIIAVQVENEYGSFGDDHVYMRSIQKMLLDSGFNHALLYTADGPEQLAKGTLPGVPAVVNFGPGDAPKAFAALDKFRSGGPFMCGEYWAGWFDHWGGKHASTDAALQTRELSWMLEKGYSVSLYMFHGGTSFGWMNGANSQGKNYQPDVTSYDYDAALDESGRPKPKYFAFRDAIAKATGIAPPPVPSQSPIAAIPKLTVSGSVSLWSILPPPVHSENPLSMEDLDQAYGYILYRTHLEGPVAGTLVLDRLHDYAQVYVDGNLAGTLDRRLDQNQMPLDIKSGRSQLDILVENTGRVNFTAVLRGERKGITNQVTLAGRPVRGWDIYTLPMSEPSKLPFQAGDCAGPCFYRAAIDVQDPSDAYLDTTQFSKGQVWLNGTPLGRVWNIGPQTKLYLPGPWLKKGPNEIVIFDLGAHSAAVCGLPAKPVCQTGN